jgi:DedD protein
VQDPLKERLTGAAILVVVVVLAVPEMFRGRPGRASSNAAPTVSSAEPLRTYPIPDAGTAPSAGQATSPPGQPTAETDAGPPAPTMAPTATPATAAPQQLQPTVSAAAAPVTGKAPATQGGWAVQVGSFRVRELAERLAREVRAKGFKVHVVGPDDRGLIRVRSALQPDKATALALKQQMVARGLKPIVNASP